MRCLRAVITCGVASVCSYLLCTALSPSQNDKLSIIWHPMRQRKWATPRSNKTSSMNKSLLAKSYPSLCVVSGNDYEINIYLKCVLAPSLTQTIMEDHIRRSATFHKRGRDTGLLPANLGETPSLWVCRKLLPWAEEFKCIWVMNNAASALILSRTVVLRRTLSCEAKLFIYHLMFQRSPASLSSGYWLKEWDQGHEWMTQDF